MLHARYVKVVSIVLYPLSIGVRGEDNHYNLLCLFTAAEVMQHMRPSNKINNINKPFNS
jgi:hypothetical protein